MTNNPQTLKCPRCEGPMFDLEGPGPGHDDPVCILDGAHYVCKTCTCRVEDAFSCYQFPRVFPTPGATRRQLADSKLDCDERSKRMADSSGNADVHSRQESNWVADTARVARLVAAGQSDLAPLFWIRLYGVLREMYGRLVSSHEFALKLGVRPDPAILRFLIAVEKMAAIFSEDEKLYIQYRRDVECHPLQFNYERTMDKRGVARERFNHKVLAKTTPVTLGEFRAAVKRVLSTAPNEVSLAQRFAARSLSMLQELESSACAVYG